MVARFAPDIDVRLPKPQIAARLVERAGLPWDGTCESTGSTITAEGLRRLRESLNLLIVGRPAGPTTADPAFGTPYRTAEAPAVAAATTIVLERDLEAVERGSQAHVDIQNALSKYLEERGVQPLSPGAGEPAFDAAWVGQSGAVVAEVKSITAANRRQQFRLGLGQVVSYRYLVAARVRRPVHAVLVLEVEPTDDERAIAASVGVEVTWPGDFGRFDRLA